MTEAQPTPGPWTIEEYGDEDAPALVIHKDTETRVCFMATPGSRGDPARIEADARLIAAAPDMLAALQFILDHIADKHRGPSDLYPAFGLNASSAVEVVRAAIAKATGSLTAERGER